MVFFMVCEFLLIGMLFEFFSFEEIEGDEFVLILDLLLFFLEIVVKIVNVRCIVGVV